MHRIIAPVVAAGALAGLGGCSPQVEDSSRAFQPQPEDNLSTLNCRRPGDWAASIDTNPSLDPEEETQEDREHFETRTVGVGRIGETPPGMPLQAGATVYQLPGEARYEIATSDDEPGDTDQVDLNEESYARILEVPDVDEWKLVFTAYLREDRTAYFAAYCLPNSE